MTPDTIPVSISVDFSSPVGKIKPLHGVNNSPETMGEPIESIKDAGIPLVRLHDSHGKFGGAHFVDIPNIFPDFDADEENPRS